MRWRLLSFRVRVFLKSPVTRTNRVSREYILQWFTQPNHQRDNTHCLNHKSYLHFTHKRDFYTHEQTRTWVYLKASLVPTKHKPIPFSVYSPIPKCICFLSSNLTRLQVTKFLRNISLRSPHPAGFFCRSQVPGHRSQVINKVGRRYLKLEI